MDIPSWLLLITLLALGWYWLNSLHALEVARKAGKKVCDELDLQFLDDTVASTRLRLARDHAGRRVFHRTYALNSPRPATRAATASSSCWATRSSRSRWSRIRCCPEAGPHARPNSAS
jgi:hypothetical protein